MLPHDGWRGGRRERRGNRRFRGRGNVGRRPNRRQYEWCCNRRSLSWRIAQLHRGDRNERVHDQFLGRNDWKGCWDDLGRHWPWFDIDRRSRKLWQRDLGRRATSMPGSLRPFPSRCGLCDHR